jgi:type I restriction enzyme S subunit
MSNHVEYVPLSELAKINPRKDVRINEESTPVSFIPMGDVSESGKWVRQQTRPLGEVDSGYTSFKEGDVLFAKITPCMENGKGCHARNLINGIGFGSTEFHVLRARERADARFIYHWTQTPMLRLRAESAMSGSAGQQRVKTWFFDEFEVPNLPLTEQRRIADVLDTVDAAIQETDSVVEKQEQVKTGLLQDLLTRGLDADGQLRDPEREAEAFRETEVGIVPETWNVETCAEVLSMSNGKSKTKKELEAETGDIPVWGGNGMTGYCSGPLFDQRGIVIGRVGEYCGSVHSTEGPSWITDNAIFATVESERVSLDYAALYLKWFDLSSKSTRTGQPLMTQTAVKEVPFLRPSLEEQERIVDRVQSLQDQQRSEKAYQDKLRQLKTALMQDLLTGRVRVPEAEARVDEVVA